MASLTNLLDVPLDTTLRTPSRMGTTGQEMLVSIEFKTLALRGPK